MAGLVLTGLVAAGCSFVPERRQEDITAFTQEYARAPGAAALQDCGRPWWHCFKNDELNLLVREALAVNPGMGQVRARLDAAAATARVSLADLLPSAAITGGADRSVDNNSRDDGFSLRGAAGYEIDVWGANRAAHKADTYAARAAAQDVQAAEITLTASVVENWLRLMAAREEEALLKEQVKTNDLMLNLQSQRFAGGMVGALDVLQQKEVLASSRAQLPDVQARGELLTHQIALLTGDNPSSPRKVSGDKLPAALSLPEAGVPSQLLRSRPDVIAAWLRLVSADWAQDSARAERLPTFSIDADYTVTGGKFSALFDTWVLNLALNLAAPVFQGGALEAQQARRKALTDEAFHAYRETVLTAIGEVEGALTRHHFQQEKVEALKDQLETSRAALSQAHLSYSNGATSYVSILNSLTRVQSVEVQLVRARLDLALAAVALYRAIGVQTKEAET